MNCTSATFETTGEAQKTRRYLRGSYQIIAVAKHCERCDGYHLVADTRTWGNQTRVAILKLVAQGYRDKEIGQLLGLSEITVSVHMHRMMRRMYALSRPHLVAIAIALGTIAPNDFIPAPTEGHEPRNGKSGAHYERPAVLETFDKETVDA